MRYVIEVLRPFLYRTLWLWKRHKVTQHQVIILYNDMFDHMHGIMRALAKKRTLRNEDIFFAMKIAPQKLSQYYAQVAASTGMLPSSAHFLNPFRKLQLFRVLEKRMHINPGEETFHTTQYQEALLTYVENE